MTNEYENRVDFAISYAGEDLNVAKQIDSRLRELGFDVFFARRNLGVLIGVQGDMFLEELFKKAKQVVVIVSESYRKKPWTQHEWDVIRERKAENRFIPVRLDDTPLLGLPSTVFYIDYHKMGIDFVIDTAVKRLLDYESSEGISRPNEYERVLSAIQNDSKGALAQAYQLVKEKRKRDPLDDVDIPACDDPSYKIIEQEWKNVGVARRLSIKVIVPEGLAQTDVTDNLKHCAAMFFNAHRPDALIVYGYFEGDDSDSYFTAGMVTFAPFGKWEKAQDGVAYNLPVSDFEFAVETEVDPMTKMIVELGKDEDN